MIMKKLSKIYEIMHSPRVRHIEDKLLEKSSDMVGVEGFIRKCLCSKECTENYHITIYKFDHEEYRHTILPHPNGETNYFEKEKRIRRSDRELIDKF